MAILYTATRATDLSVTRADVLSSYGTLRSSSTSYLDPQYVKHAIRLVNGTLSATVNHGEPSGDTLWFHFEWSYRIADSRDDGWWFQIRDVNDNSILYVDIANGGLTGYIYGDATVSRSFNALRRSRMEYDISITVNSTETAVKVYQRNQLIIEMSTPNTLGNVGKPNYTYLAYSDMSINGTDAMSQLIWADENTRGMKLAEIPLSEVGTQTHTDWQGQTESLFNNNDEFYIISNSAPDRKFTSILQSDISATGLYPEEYLLNTQDSTPRDIYFKPDGTKMYMVGSSTDNVYQYSLSTPWDVTTATYDVVSFNVNAQAPDPQGIFFKPDGTSMYIVCSSSDSAFQYDLTTPWDISTSVYSTKSINLSTEDTGTTGIFFKTDGTKMYMVGVSSDAVHQYTLSTAWDLSTATYDSISHSVSSQDTSPYNIFFRDNGTTMYMVGRSSDRIHQYRLGTPWDISTISSITTNFSISSYEGNVGGIYVTDSDVYIVGESSDRVWQYKSGLAFNGPTSNYDIKTVNLSSRAWRTVDASITDFRHITRVGTTDYDAAVVHTTSDQVRSAYQSQFETNPATGLPWTFEEITAAEFGVKTEL